MFVPAESLDLLFREISKPVAVSVRQPREAIVRLAHQRLASDARDIAAIHVIAAAQIQNGQGDRCLRLLQHHAVALKHNATGHRLAGYAYLMQQRTTTARVHFQAAVRLDARLFDCWIWLGRIDEQHGVLDQAAACYRRAMYFEDARHEAALALSRLHTRTGRLTRGIATLRSVLSRDRRSARLNAALARLLLRRASMLRRKRKSHAEEAVLKRAVSCFQTSIAAAPQADTYIDLGRLQQRLGNFTEAAAAFSKAVQMNGECPAAITHLANNAVENGEIDEALRLYRQALEISPDFAPAHFKYSRAQRFKNENPTIEYARRLAELVANRDRRPHEQIQLNFALAKVLDDIGQYDRAWQHYDRANRLKKGHSQSLSRTSKEIDGRSRVPLRDTVESAISFFTPEFFGSNRATGNPSTAPVFIVGMPRSGTTLTEQILSSHPDVVGAGELKDIERIRQQIAGLGAENANDQQWLYPNVLAALKHQQLRDFADTHVAFLDQLRRDARFVTDKMPTNFIHLGLIAILFPNATIIHCRRDPMDVLISCYCQNLSPPFCDLESLALYHQQYRRLMDHWNQVLPLKIHSVDYESMVSDPETHSRKLIEFCGLDWNERCLNFHANERAVHTPSKWQVRQPMYRTSVGKWKRFESHLSQIVELVHQDDFVSTSAINEFQSSVA